MHEITLDESESQTETSRVISFIYLHPKNVRKQLRLLMFLIYPII